MFKKVLKRVLLGLLVAFIAIQFVRPAKNLATGPSPDDIITKYNAPANVRQILATACYDCHSDTTRYPWYAEIQPTAWWLNQHVDHAKNELNFSRFAAYATRHKRQKLEAAIDEVTDKAMPLPSYLILHHDARLSPEQIKALTEWFEEILEKVEDEGG